jgi:hypothetical protein
MLQLRRASRSDLQNRRRLGSGDTISAAGDFALATLGAGMLKAQERTPRCSSRRRVSLRPFTRQRCCSIDPTTARLHLRFAGRQERRTRCGRTVMVDACAALRSFEKEWWLGRNRKTRYRLRRALFSLQSTFVGYTLGYTKLTIGWG